MIKVYLNRKVSETQITIGNQYESGVNAIAFDLSELKEKWPNGNIYLLVSRKEHTWPYSIDDGEFKIEYVLTWKRGFYQMNVVVTDEKITDQLESSNTIFVSDTINAYVDENQINAKALNEQELPRELQIVYDDLITLKKNIEKDLADGKYIGPQGPKGEPGDVTEEYRNLASQIAQNASDAQASAINAQVSATNAQKALDDTKDFVNQTKTELNQIKTDTELLKEEANTSAVNAQSSATSAQESATNASQSATSAQESSTNASQSATSAQESSTNAQTSATNAQKALDDTKDFVNQTKTELNQIKTDTSVLKDEANTSAVNAKASETKAKEYADNLQASTDDISQLKEDIGNKAPAIIEKASGKTIVINDSSNLPIRILSGTGKIIITGKNIFDDTKNGYAYFIPFEAKAGTLFTLITNGELSEGGNIKFTDENDEDVWFAIDAGKTKASQKIQANVKGFVNLLVQKEGLKYCFSVGENDEYEEYVEQVITAPVDSEQLKAIHTNYPTTVLTSENEISVEYVADTKHYIDKKFEELNQAIVNTQITLL